MLRSKYEATRTHHIPVWKAPRLRDLQIPPMREFFVDGKVGQLPIQARVGWLCFEARNRVKLSLT
jgi:hypothetical protein